MIPNIIWHAEDESVVTGMRQVQIRGHGNWGSAVLLKKPAIETKSI